MSAWAVVVAFTGGVEAHPFGITFRARGAFRPLATALVLFCAAAWLYRVELRSAARDVSATGTAMAPWIVAVLALVTVIIAVRYGSFVAAGSDSYGYVSQAYGWERGELPRPYATPLTLPFQSGDRIQAPLGYRVGRAPHTIVPTYAPGLPLLMALGILIAGAIGPYLIVPLSVGLFVWATYALARRIAGVSAGVAAALIAATSPIVLFMSLWPMSDLPAGAAWTGAAACALSDSRRGALHSGMLAALAVLIRPNLAPLALVPFVWIVLASAGRERQIRAVWFAAPAGVAAVAIAALNAYWYGSPFVSGYGGLHALYAMQNVWPNLQRYPVWLWRSQSPWIVVALATACAFRRGRSRSRRILFVGALFVVTLICYVGYAPYDQWWYLRFLLPGLGALFAAAAAGVVAVAERFTKPWGSTLAIALLGLIAWRSSAYAVALDMFGPFQISEHKYVDVGLFVARETAGDAVFFALQHSGTIRFYGGRHTLRYDQLDGPEAHAIVEALERLGLHPYLAVEDAEMPDVQRAFQIPTDRQVSWPYVGRTERFGGISVFDLAAHPRARAPKPIPSGIGPRYVAPVPIE